MIALRDFSASLAGVQILYGIDFAAGAGELVALCGPNGAGKTTLLRALAGLLPGQAPVDARRVAYLPQSAQCAWPLTVRELVQLGRLPHDGGGDGMVQKAMDLCGIADHAELRIDRLSGGQLRRAMLARCFATDPDIFLLDEPTSDLDPAAAHEILHLLGSVAHGENTGPTPRKRLVIVVLHALDLAADYADRMVLLVGGQIMRDGPPSEVMPAAADAFGMMLGLDPAPRLLRRM